MKSKVHLSTVNDISELPETLRASRSTLSDCTAVHPDCAGELTQQTPKPYEQWAWALVDTLLDQCTKGIEWHRTALSLPHSYPLPKPEGTDNTPDGDDGLGLLSLKARIYRRFRNAAALSYHFYTTTGQPYSVRSRQPIAAKCYLALLATPQRRHASFFR